MTFDQIMDLRDHYAETPAHAGKIRWFNASSGEGIVQLSDGQMLYCHFTAIHGIDKNGYAYATEADRALLDTIDGMECMVLPYISPGYVGCERVVIMDWFDRT